MVTFKVVNLTVVFIFYSNIIGVGETRRRSELKDTRALPTRTHSGEYYASLDLPKLERG